MVGAAAGSTGAPVAGSVAGTVVSAGAAVVVVVSSGGTASVPGGTSGSVPGGPVTRGRERAVVGLGLDGFGRFAAIGDLAAGDDERAGHPERGEVRRACPTPRTRTTGPPPRGRTPTTRSISTAAPCAWERSTTVRAPGARLTASKSVERGGVALAHRLHGEGDRLGDRRVGDRHLHRRLALEATDGDEPLAGEHRAAHGERHARGDRRFDLLHDPFGHDGHVVAARGHDEATEPDRDPGVGADGTEAYWPARTVTTKGSTVGPGSLAVDLDVDLDVGIGRARVEEDVRGLHPLPERAAVGEEPGGGRRRRAQGEGEVLGPLAATVGDLELVDDHPPQPGAGGDGGGDLVADGDDVGDVDGDDRARAG